MSTREPMRPESDGRIPFVVGAAGHRDLRPEDEPELEKAVRAVFESLRQRMPNTPLLLLSALAAGADQLAARVALECGVRLAAIVPMPLDLYRQQLPPDARATFEDLRGKASATIELPAECGTDDDLAGTTDFLNRSYEALALFLAANSQALIALWDGIALDKPGATARVVRYQLERAAAGAGAVYHIRTPRRSNPEVDREAFGITLLPEPNAADSAAQTDSNDPERSLEQYNCDVRAAFTKSAERDKTPATLPPFAQSVAAAYSAADALSLCYNQRSKTVLKALLLCALTAVGGFEAYAHIFPEAAAIWLLYPAALLAGWIIYRHAVHAAVERRYLDYRALAEGLRIQLFWSLCGIRKPAADWYLRRHAAEPDWIRSALRAVFLAGVQQEVDCGDLGFDRALHLWVMPQAAWHERRARSQKAMLHAVERWSDRLLFALWLVSILIPLSLILRSDWLHEWQSVALHQPIHGILLLLIPVPSLTAGLCRVWVDQAGFSEQARRYRHMARVFQTAAGRLRESLQAGTIEGARETVYQLGIEALEENAEWLLLHRDRPLRVVGGG